MPAQRRTINNRPAALALLGIVVLFIAIVGKGWQGLFSTQAFGLSVFVGFVVAVIATVLAYAIANERVTHTSWNSAALAYFFFLFNISALGTVNAMFATFQSANILRSEIESATTSAVKLRDLGLAQLATPASEQLTSEVATRWKNLRAEIENPLRCGQGQEAARRAAELQQVLPTFRMLAGAVQCKNNHELIVAYEKQIAELVATSPEVIKDKPRLEFKAHLITETQQLLEGLRETQKQLNGRFFLNDIKGRIFDVAESYSKLRQELDTRSSKTIEAIPPKIDTTAVSALGDIGQVLPFIMSRLSDVSTYVYLAIALILDMAVIVSFQRVLQSGPDSRTRLAASSPVAL
jgi:hypothetical protein